MFHNEGWAKMCRPCAIEKQGKHANFNKGRDVLITTLFKCPAEKCSSSSNTFKDFVWGVCCSDAYNRCAEMYKDFKGHRQNILDSEVGEKILAQCMKMKNEQHFRELLDNSNILLRNCYDKGWFYQI